MMMGLTWYMLGILTVGCGYFLYVNAKENRLHWLSVTGLGIGTTSILFSIAWAVGSVLEGVPRAASMGLLIFGLGGIVFLIVMLRIVAVQNKSESSQSENSIKSIS